MSKRTDPVEREACRQGDLPCVCTRVVDQCDGGGERMAEFPTMHDDGLDIPDFLRISQAERNAAWVRNPPKAMPSGFGGRVLSETEKLYRASIEREKAAKRAAAEPRFAAMREKAAEDKAARDAVAEAVQSTMAHKPEQQLKRKRSPSKRGRKREGE